MIKDGQLITSFNKQQLLKIMHKELIIHFQTTASFEQFVTNHAQSTIFSLTEKVAQEYKVIVRCMPENIAVFIKILASSSITNYSEIPFSLENHFMRFYTNKERAVAKWSYYN